MAEIRYLTASEMIDHVADDVELRRSVRESMPVDDDGITLLWVHDHYHIEWSRLDTPMQVIRWVLHLSEKAECTLVRIEIFLFIVCEKFGWEPHGM